MHFDELVLKVPDDEIRVRFHPRMTVLSGLAAPERRALADTIVGALTGGTEQTALRCIDGSGRTVIVLSGGDGPARARHDDDGSGAAPVGDLINNPDVLRDLILVQAAEVGIVAHAARGDEPRELREARASLAEITAQVQKALEEAQHTDAIQAQIDAIDEQLRAAEEGAARHEYAKVLAHIEDLQAEAASSEVSPEQVENDTRLLARAGAARELADRWVAAAGRLADAVEAFGDAGRLPSEELDRAATLPAHAGDELSALVDAVTAAEARRDRLDHHLQSLTVGKLPVTSQDLVGELGLLDQEVLWAAADRLILAGRDVTDMQVTLGGLGAGPGGAAPVAIEAMETAHRDLDVAQQAAESVRVPGVAGTGLGLAVALAGAVGSPILIPFGMLIAAVVGTLTLLIPRRHVAIAAAAEQSALDSTGAPSYLGFHLRRVDASMDPTIRDTVESTSVELRQATAAWLELVGPGVDVDQTRLLEAEVRSYHEALGQLGDRAEEIEGVRRELADQVQPAVAGARIALAAACTKLGIAEDDVEDPACAVAAATRAVERGHIARNQVVLELAEAEEHELTQALEAELAALGIGAGAVEARVDELSHAVHDAEQRTKARARARDEDAIARELEAQQQLAARLHRPDWDSVTAAEADQPDVNDLAERRVELQCALAEARPSIDLRRVADRQDALQRRVAALEAKHSSEVDPSGDPGAVADIQKHLADRLAQAAKAGPHGDAVPALLDEVLDRVPVDRKYDLLDHLYRMSESHQLVYLTDDAFVAAWARQQAEGTVILLEPEPEPV